MRIKTNFSNHQKCPLDVKFFNISLTSKDERWNIFSNKTTLIPDLKDKV